MKDSKTILLLIVSLLLLLVSVVLLWSWSDRFYNYQRVATPATAVVDDVTRINRVKDSLQQVYHHSINGIDKSIDSLRNSTDSLTGGLSDKLAAFYKLRAEVSDLFTQQGTDQGMGMARVKIAELQKRITALRLNISDIENENRRLTAVLKQLNAGEPIRVETPSREPERSLNKMAAFVTSDLQLAAVMEKDEKVFETNRAADASRIVGSFIVKNNSTEPSSFEMMVVVLKPDGQVLQKSTWESGSFQTTEGKKIYSCKMKFDSNAGEARRLLFTLDSETYQKGKYTMQLYHKGKLIGRITRPLS